MYKRAYRIVKQASYYDNNTIQVFGSTVLQVTSKGGIFRGSKERTTRQQAYEGNLAGYTRTQRITSGTEANRTTQSSQNLHTKHHQQNTPSPPSSTNNIPNRTVENTLNIANNTLHKARDAPNGHTSLAALEAVVPAHYADDRVDLAATQSADDWQGAEDVVPEPIHERLDDVFFDWRGRGRGGQKRKGKRTEEG